MTPTSSLRKSHCGVEQMVSKLLKATFTSCAWTWLLRISSYIYISYVQQIWFARYISLATYIKYATWYIIYIYIMYICIYHVHIIYSCQRRTWWPVPFLSGVETTKRPPSVLSVVPMMLQASSQLHNFKVVSMDIQPKDRRVARWAGTKWVHKPWIVMADDILLQGNGLIIAWGNRLIIVINPVGVCRFLPLLTCGMDAMVWSLEGHATTLNLPFWSDVDPQSIDADWNSFTHVAELSSLQQKGRSSGLLPPELLWSVLIAGQSRTKRWKSGNVENPHEGPLELTLWRLLDGFMLSRCSLTFPNRLMIAAFRWMSLANNKHLLKNVDLWLIRWSQLRSRAAKIGLQPGWKSSEADAYWQELHPLAISNMTCCVHGETCWHYEIPHRNNQWESLQVQIIKLRWRTQQSILWEIKKTDHSLGLMSLMTGCGLILDDRRSL